MSCFFTLISGLAFIDKNDGIPSSINRDFKSPIFKKLDIHIKRWCIVLHRPFTPFPFPANYFDFLVCLLINWDLIISQLLIARFFHFFIGPQIQPKLIAY